MFIFLYGYLLAVIQMFIANHFVSNVYATNIHNYWDLLWGWNNADIGVKIRQFSVFHSLPNTRYDPNNQSRRRPEM